MIRKNIFKLLCAIIVAAILFQTAACGTILYPERRGLRHGRIDPVVVALDGVCLLFFIIPGIIAFVVDFSTGAVYLPRGRKYGDEFKNNKALVSVDISGTEIDKTSIEQIISEKTGKDIDLNTGNYKTFKITDPEIIDK